MCICVYVYVNSPIETKAAASQVGRHKRGDLMCKRESNPELQHFFLPRMEMACSDAADGDLSVQLCGLNMSSLYSFYSSKQHRDGLTSVNLCKYLQLQVHE